MEPAPTKRELILDAAVGVFGKFGFKKTSVDDLAAAAGISKQGLYLHFASKEAIFQAGLQRYLDGCLSRVQEELNRADASLLNRMAGAMDAWFGRHLATFTPESFDLIEASKLLAGDRLKEYESALQAKLTKALAESADFKKAKNVCSPREITQVLLACGLTWKHGCQSRTEFMQQMKICIRACCQLEN
ncbi:MAG TPA: TetR/AcrR family transcriptional regulator [Chthoniobacterales bacterium]|nr:TetR/AcrR family transcriptional regulator [Chthoniobacterales bacterium]